MIIACGMSSERVSFGSLLDIYLAIARLEKLVQRSAPPTEQAFEELNRTQATRGLCRHSENHAAAMATIRIRKHGRDGPTHRPSAKNVKADWTRGSLLTMT